MQNGPLINTIVEKFSRHTECAPLKNEALWDEYILHKQLLNSKRSDLFAQTQPTQLKLRQQIEDLHTKALVALLDMHRDKLFPRIDMSFLNTTALNAKNRPQWAIFDSDLGVNEFAITYTCDVSCKPYDSDDDEAIQLKVKNPWFTISQKHFEKLFSADVQSQMKTAFNDYICNEYLNLPTAWQMGGNDSCFVIPHQRNVPAVLEYRRLAWRHNETRKVTLCFRATFDNFIPVEIQNKKLLLREMFDELFFVAEIPDWEPLVETTIPAADPLLIGRKENNYWLIAAFDLTDTEKYINQEFTL